MKRFSAFTLIELIVVMGILAILATIVVIAVNPSRQFAASRNAKRASDVRAIQQAINQHAADNNGTVYSGITTNTKIIGTTVASNYVDLTSTLVPNYLSAIPTDPSGGTAADTNYVVYKSATNQIVVQSENVELGDSITSGSGGMVTFDGTDDYINVPSTAAISSFTDMTLEAWIKRNGSSAGLYPDLSIIAGKHALSGGANDSYMLRWISGGVGFAFNTSDVVYTTTQMNNGTWYHVAASRSGTTCRMFLNGVLQQTMTCSGTMNVNTTPFRIGGYGGTIEYWNGIIDEVRLSNNARYTANFTPVRRYTEDANTVLMWHFDEGNGTTTLDNSSNALTGTFTNGPVWTVE